MKRSVTVSVAGQDLVLRSDCEEQVVRRLAAQVDKRFREITKTGRADTQKVALLVALQFAEELHQEQAAAAAMKKDVKARSQALLRLLKKETGL